jgi:hypothetical protein
MSEPNNLWICVGYVRRSDGDYAAEFIIDARLYPDDRTARAVVSAANAVLQGRQIAAELEFIVVRSDEPSMDLPTWDEYHRQALGEPDDQQ